MRAPLYASPEFPNCNPDLHAGRIDPMLFPDVDDSFGDGELEIVEDLPELAASESELEVVGEEIESPRDSMIRLVAAVATHADIEEELGEFTSLSLPNLPPLSSDLLSVLPEADIEALTSMTPPSVIVDPVPLPLPAPMPVPAPIESGVLEVTSDVEVEAAVEAAVPIEVAVEVAVPVAIAVEAAAAPTIEPAPSAPVAANDTIDDAFLRLISAIHKTSGTSLSLDLLTELLSGRPVPSALLEASPILDATKLIARDGGSVSLADVPRRAAREWALIVRDEGGDFDGTGGKTLDEFAAEIAAALAGDAARADEMRRALRNMGVAAYGLVSDAA